MHVLPEDLGLEPVTLEAVELEAVSHAQVLASDPALLSETPGAPTFKQVRSTQVGLGEGGPGELLLSVYMHLTGWATDGAEKLLMLVHWQNWDLTFTKSRLEHKFCAWDYAQLGGVDTVHAVLLIAVSLFPMLWPLRSASARLPALPHWMSGMGPFSPSLGSVRHRLPFG